MSHGRQTPILNGSDCDTAQLEMPCFWTKTFVFRFWNKTLLFSCFFPQCGLFYVPDSTQPIKHKQWDKYSAMFKYSAVQIPSLSRFPIYLSPFYSSNLEWKWNSVLAWYFRIPFGWETAGSPSLPWCWWVKTRLGAALLEPTIPHRFILCFVRVIICSANVEWMWAQRL